MDRIEALVEIHRELVTRMGQERFRTEPADEPFAIQQPAITIEGRAVVGLELSRIWFFRDAGGRRWTEETGAGFAPPLRHFAIDLAFRDSRIVVEKVDGLPIPATVPDQTVTVPNQGGPRDGESMTIPAREVPLLGRLGLHEHVEQFTVDAAALTRNLGLRFAAQAAPRLQASPPPNPLMSSFFGPDLSRQANGAVIVAGQDPRVVWELDYAEKYWILHCYVGNLMVTKEMLGGLSRAAAETKVLDDIARKLAEAVRGKLAAMADVGLLPEDAVVDPSGATDGAYVEIDALCVEYPNAGATEESLVFQFRTRDELPAERALPQSVLVQNPAEKLALATAGWSILRGARESFIADKCLLESDFVAGEPFKLRKAVSIEADGEPATLKALEVVIEDETDTTAGRVVARGKLSGDIETPVGDIGDWDAHFTNLGLDLVLEDVPRDPVEGEPGFGTISLTAINQRLGELAAQRCASGDTDAMQQERDALKAQVAQLPRTIGVATRPNPPDPSVEPDLDYGNLAVFVIIVLATLGFGLVGLLATSLGFVFGRGAILGKIEQKIIDALRQDRGGSALPLAGYLPVLQTFTNQALAVYFREIPEVLYVSCAKADSAVSPPGEAPGDADYVLQLVGGSLDGNGTRWRLSVSDAAELILQGRLRLFVDPAHTGGVEVPVDVATSSLGRRYLRARADPALSNNLAALPVCEAVH